VDVKQPTYQLAKYTTPGYLFRAAAYYPRVSENAIANSKEPLHRIAEGLVGFLEWAYFSVNAFTASTMPLP
jgi:hypothetical protein